MKNIGWLRVSFFVVALQGVMGLASAQAFVDGGFESPEVASGQFKSGVDTPAFMDPWFGEHSFGIANGSGSWGTGGHSGAQYAYIQSTSEFGGAGALYQAVSGLTVGAQYEVSFWMARRNGNVGGNSGNVISVLADSQQILAPTAASDPAWQEFTTDTFTATATSMTIRFQGQVPQGDTAALLDDVSIRPVPEPATVATLVTGIAMVVRRRRLAKG